MFRYGYPESAICNYRGFTYLEIIAGIVIITFILFGMNAVFGVGIKNNKKAENVNIALGLARELMEEAKSREFSNTGSLESTFGDFKGIGLARIDPSNPNKKLITVTVSGPVISDVELKCIVANQII